jgi:hypothetical protein
MDLGGIIQVGTLERNKILFGSPMKNVLYKTTEQNFDHKLLFIVIL